MGIYSHSVHVAVMSRCCVRSLICKTWTGLSAWTLANGVDPDQTPQNGASVLRRPFRVCTIYFNYRKLKVTEKAHQIKSILENKGHDELSSLVQKL